MAIDDLLDAFCDYKTVNVKGSPVGHLSGYDFAVKDIFDVAGYSTGAGNPDWLSTHEPAIDTAPAVRKLLDAGANLVGVTQCTELTRGIVGDNVHYRTPKNPRAPGRVPGGSSSGSASAVAGEAVDFALGSDTNGSISVPASFCGLFGLKSTHGRISLDGVFKHAPSLDTVGWFARDAEVLSKVGNTLLHSTTSTGLPRRVVVSEEAFALVDPSVRTPLLDAVNVLKKVVSEVIPSRVCSVGLQELCEAHYVLHGREAWNQFKPWFEEENPRLSFQIAERCMNGARYSEEDATNAKAFLKPIQEDMKKLLSGGAFICVPATASVAWPAGVPLSQIGDSIARTAMLVTMGTILGVPQLTLPFAENEGLPVGISLLGERGSDEALLEFAREIDAASR